MFFVEVGACYEKTGSQGNSVVRIPKFIKWKIITQKVLFIIWVEAMGIFTLAIGLYVFAYPNGGRFSLKSLY